MSAVDLGLEERRAGCRQCGELVIYHAPAGEAPSTVFCLPEVAPGQPTAATGHTIRRPFRYVAERSIECA